MQDTAAINKMLMSHGLGRLEDGAGLMAQLGFLVRDHAHFQSMIMRCEPADRPAMYDSLTPYMQFKAHSLAHYLIEANREAEARRLPVMDAETGILKEFKTPELRSIEKGVEEAIAKGYLELTCKKCTKFELFSGRSKADAIQKAREAGWKHHELADHETCPACNL